MSHNGKFKLFIDRKIVKRLAWSALNVRLPLHSNSVIIGNFRMKGELNIIWKEQNLAFNVICKNCYLNILALLCVKCSSRRRTENGGWRTDLKGETKELVVVMSRIVLMMMAYWRKDCLLFTSCILKACWCSTLYWMSTYDPHLHIKENVYSHSCKLFIVLSWELCESTVVVLVKGSGFSNNSYFADIQLAINFPADSPMLLKKMSIDCLVMQNHHVSFTN